MNETRSAASAAHRVGSGAGRLMRAWQGLPHERRLAVYASIGLFLTLFLPWYQETVLVANGAKQPMSASISVTGWGAFSFVEAAVLLVAAGVLVLLFQRAEGKAFHVPGGDGGVITAAGLWTCVLVVWRIFDKQSTSIHGPGADISGIEWGIFVALAVAAFLAYAGTRIRAAHRPEPPLPGEQQQADGDPSLSPPARRPRRPSMARSVAGEAPGTPRTAREARPTGETPATPRTAREARPTGETPATPRTAREARPTGEAPATPRTAREARPTRRRRSTARQTERASAQPDALAWKEPGTDWIDGQGRRTRGGAAANARIQSETAEDQGILRGEAAERSTARETTDDGSARRGERQAAEAGRGGLTGHRAQTAGADEAPTLHRARDEASARRDRADDAQTEPLSPSTQAARRTRRRDDS
jgi:hypothetical protein